jgi:hypothetical protein
LEKAVQRLSDCFVGPLALEEGLSDALKRFGRTLDVNWFCVGDGRLLRFEPEPPKPLNLPVPRPVVERPVAPPIDFGSMSFAEVIRTAPSTESQTLQPDDDGALDDMVQDLLQGGGWLQSGAAAPIVALPLELKELSPLAVVESPPASPQPSACASPLSSACASPLLSAPSWPQAPASPLLPMPTISLSPPASPPPKRNGSNMMMRPSTPPRVVSPLGEQIACVPLALPAVYAKRIQRGNARRRLDFNALPQVCAEAETPRLSALQKQSAPDPGLEPGFAKLILSEKCEAFFSPGSEQRSAEAAPLCVEDLGSGDPVFRFPLAAPPPAGCASGFGSPEGARLSDVWSFGSVCALPTDKRYGRDEHPSFFAPAFGALPACDDRELLAHQRQGFREAAAYHSRVWAACNEGLPERGVARTQCGGAPIEQGALLAVLQNMEFHRAQYDRFSHCALLTESIVALLDAPPRDAAGNEQAAQMGGASFAPGLSQCDQWVQNAML